MKKLGLMEAFQLYGAVQKNLNWSVSAENKAGELVVSLWLHHFAEPVGKTIRYIDKVSRWSGLGNKEFRKNIDKAFSSGQVVRAIIARTSDEDAVDKGKDASKLKNIFTIKKDWFGKVVLWDGDIFEIHFIRVPKDLP